MAPFNLIVDEKTCDRCGGGMIAVWPRAKTEEERKRILAEAERGTLRPVFECIRCGCEALPNG